MSLTNNPSHMKPGETRNPAGRPKGTTGKKDQVRERLLKKHLLHPVDRLVTLAKLLEERGRFEEAAAIWTNLLKYFEPTKKPVECAPEKYTPDDSVEAAEETFKLLQEIEQHGIEAAKGRKDDGLEAGTPPVSPEASTETDLSGHKEQ